MQNIHFQDLLGIVCCICKSSIISCVFHFGLDKFSRKKGENSHCLYLSTH